MHRVSLGGRYGRPRGKRLREASRYRRNATLFDCGVTQDRTTMNTLRRLCGTMPPTHVSHPPTSFLCSCCTETGHICSFFEGEDPRPRTRTLPLPVVLGVKGLPVSLRRRRVLCTLPILQPCALRHALHCYGCVRSGLREAICLALGTHGTKTNSRKGVRQHRRGCTWRLRS